MSHSIKGFTLIELLIVIGILAILATTVVLVLNPAQILAETRDTQRISDLGSVSSALGLYLATVANPAFGSVGGDTPAGTACGDATHWRASGANAAPISTGFAPFVSPGTAASLPASGFRAVDGTGWVSANLNNISGGSPLGNLPVDPSSNTATANAVLTGTAGHFYAFQCGNTAATRLQYEIDANMESTKFSNTGTADVESTDGGNVASVYEIGTSPGLAL